MYKIEGLTSYEFISFTNALIFMSKTGIKKNILNQDGIIIFDIKKDNIASLLNKTMIVRNNFNTKKWNYRPYKTLTKIG